MNNVMAWLRRNTDRTDYNDYGQFYGEYLGHRIRYTDHSNELEIGHADFDRWANSVAHSITICEGSIPLQVNRAIIEAKKAGDPSWYTTMKVIKLLYGESK
jgi:hypothetical protein